MGQWGEREGGTLVTCDDNRDQVSAHRWPGYAGNRQEK